MFPLRTRKWNEGEDWECRKSGSMDEMCKKIRGAHLRTDRGGWCGCDDNHYHIEWHNDEGVCVRNVKLPGECDKAK